MITKNDLIGWLEDIDKKLENKIILVAVGGTAMTLLGLKPSTRDIDFCMESKDINIFRKLAKNGKFKVDLFQDGYIFSEQLPDDYLDKSTRLETNLANIELRTLSLIDIILTKAARYNERDEEDIGTIAKTIKIEKEELIKRFNQMKDTFAGREGV
ncbi:MAG: hypothetical protein KAK00_09995 [Nanoarchaeota archaeon]|nr:hypothetical protein [Nanoarchaeota archaeon]